MAEGQLITPKHILARHGDAIIKALKRNLLDDGLIASRKLYQSVRFEAKVMGRTYTLNIIMEDYWKSVDQGQKPGTMPDVQKILKWMSNKKIQPPQPRKRISALKAMPISSTLRRKGIRKAIKDRRLALAQRIANAIYKKGTIKRFGYKGSEFASSYIDWTLKERIEQDLRTELGKELTAIFKQYER